MADTSRDQTVLRSACDVARSLCFARTSCDVKLYIVFVFAGSEDCLYLNVWTPTLDRRAELDVMVYIHGGGTESELGPLYGAGLLTGSGHEPGVCPALVQLILCDV